MDPHKGLMSSKNLKRKKGSLGSSTMAIATLHLIFRKFYNDNKLIVFVSLKRGTTDSFVKRTQFA